MKLKHMCNVYNTADELESISVFYSTVKYYMVFYYNILQYCTVLFNILVFYSTVEYIHLFYYSILQRS